MEKEVKFIKAWIIFFAVSTIGGFMAGVFVGVIFGSVLGMFGIEVNTIKIISGIAGFIVGLPVSFICFKWSIKKFILTQLLLTKN